MQQQQTTTKQTDDVQASFNAIAARAALESTAQVRKELGAEIEAALTEQGKLNNIAEHSGKLSKDKSKESGNFFGALCNILEAAKAKGLDKDLVIVGTEAALGQRDQQTSTVRMYRKTFSRLAGSYMSEHWEADAKKAGVALTAAGKDEETGNIVQRPIPLRAVGYANARKIHSVSVQSDAARAFDAALSSFVDRIKTATKNQAAKPKDGQEALAAIPYATLTALLHAWTAAIPRRQAPKADSEVSESNPMEDAANEIVPPADGDDATEPGDGVEVRKAS